MQARAVLASEIISQVLSAAKGVANIQVRDWNRDLVAKSDDISKLLTEAHGQLDTLESILDYRNETLPNPKIQSAREYLKTVPALAIKNTQNTQTEKLVAAIQDTNKSLVAELARIRGELQALTTKVASISSALEQKEEEQQAKASSRLFRRKN